MKSALHLFIKRTYVLLAYLLAPLALLLRAAGVRVLDVMPEAIGHLALEPDAYIREQKLLGKKRISILFPPHYSLNRKSFSKLAVSNLCLLQCWEKHFFVIKNLALYVILYPLLKSPLLRHDPTPYTAQKLAPQYKKGSDCISIYKAYEKKYGLGKGFTPLIEMKQEDVENGREILRKLGLPKGAWFVSFNCRESGYYSPEALQATSGRNADINNLELALQEVIQRGGWCIRMGSSLMQPLPKRLAQYPQIIDYPKSPWVSDTMDVFLASNCRFFLGNNSGITTLAGVFGVPCVLTNVIPFGQLSVFPKDLAIFKLHRSKVTQQWLPFTECLQSYLSVSIAAADYEELQIELIENTAGEIRDVTLQMLEELDGKERLQEDVEFQQRFRNIMNSFNLSHGSPARVGLEFLKKYEELLGAKNINQQFPSRNC